MIVMLRETAIKIMLFALATAGQQIFAQASVGIQPLGSYSDGGLDQISQSNLGVHIDIPLFVHKGRGSGLGANVHLVYDSTYASGQNPVVDVGWRLTGATAPPGQAVMATTDSIWEPQCDPPSQHCNIGCYYNTYSFSFTDSTGFPHLFPDGNAVICRLVPGSIPLNEIEWDGENSGYLLSATNAGTFVTTPSGDVYNLGNVMTDTNGNSGSTTLPSGGYWVGYSTTATDDSNVSVTVNGGAYSSSNYTQWTSRSPLTIQYTDTTGASRPITVNYGLQTVSYTCPPNQFGQFSFTQTVGLVQSVVYPDNSAYYFTYYADGALKSMQLPTGGTINYVGNEGLSASCGPGLPATMSRQTSDGTTTYSQSITSMNGGYPATSTTTISHPDGSWESIAFVDVLNGQSNIFQNLNYETAHYWYSSSSALLKSTMKCYNGATGDCTTTPFSMPISEIATTTTLDSGQHSQFVQFLNNAAQVTETDEYDFGASTPTRKTVTNYASFSGSANIFDRPSSVTVYNGSGTQVSQTSYGYDEGTLTGTSGGLPGHSSVSTSRANLTSQHVWLNPEGGSLNTLWAYDDAGQKLSAQDPRGYSTGFGYDTATDTCLTSTTPPTPSSGVSQATSATCDPYVGLTATTTDANGVKTSYSYDGMLRLTAIVVTDPNGSQVARTNRSYNSPSIPYVITTTVTASPSSPEVSSVTLDGLGRTATTTGRNTAKVDTTYNSMGQVQSVSNPYIYTIDSTYGITSYLYDGIGRKTYQCQPDNSSSNSTTCAPSASYQSWSYSGNTVTFQDELGNQWKRWTDGLGRLTEVMEPNGSTKTPSMETDYTYDPLNNLTYVNQHGLSGNTARTRPFTYDSASRLLTAQNPETGTVTYTYDADGNVSTKTDARNYSVHYSWDALNRVTGKTYWQGSNQLSGTYVFGYDGKDDQANTLSPPTAFPVGRLTYSSNNSNVGAKYSYTPMGAVAQQWYCIPQTCSWATTVYATYDQAGNLTSLTYPDSRVVSQIFNAAGQLNTLNFAYWNGSQVGTPYVTVNSYDSPGHATSVTMGSGNAIVAASYNRRLELGALSYVSSGSTQWSKSYTWQANGNLQQAQDMLQNTTRQFTYDTLNRFANALDVTSGTQNPVPGGLSEGASPDAFGNVTQSGIFTFQPISFSSLNQPSGASFDAAGNITTDPLGNHYNWDYEGRLLTSNGETYTYDADGNRVEKSGSGTTDYIYFNGIQLARLVPGTWTDLIYGLGGVSAEVTASGGQSGNPAYRFTDHLGSGVGLIPATGGTPAIQDYAPYGQLFNGSSTSDPFKFTGKERDSESGNDYFGARYYASSMGRWLSPDPLGMAFADPNDPQSLNRYAYVLNNPLVFTDPDGLDCMYTNNQSWNSVDVTIVRGDCKSDKDSGVFVDGTIDANSLHYGVDQSTGATSLGYNFTNSDDDSKSGAGVTSLANLAPLNTDGQLAPSIQNQFIPQLATTSVAFNRALPVPCGVGTNFGANIGPARIGWDANTSKGLRFSANLRAGQVGPMAANLGLNGRSASLNISDTPFALTAGLSGNRATSLGMSVGFGPGGNTKGFGSARAGAYVLTGNFQDGCRAW